MSSHTEDFNLTVGRLREVIAGLPAHTPVHYNRIQDIYFDKHNWKADLHVASNDYPDEPPHIDDDYVRAFCAFTHKDEEGKIHLCITAHY